MFFWMAVGAMVVPKLEKPQPATLWPSKIRSMNSTLISILNGWVFPIFFSASIHEGLGWRERHHRAMRYSKARGQYVVLPVFSPFVSVDPSCLLHLISCHVFADAIRFVFVFSVLHYILHVCEAICPLAPGPLHHPHAYFLIQKK